jgi:hypothetical protein
MHTMGMYKIRCVLQVWKSLEPVTQLGRVRRHAEARRRTQVAASTTRRNRGFGLGAALRCSENDLRGEAIAARPRSCGRWSWRTPTLRRDDRRPGTFRQP